MSENKKKKLAVAKIKNGIVIDHIPPGKGYYVLQVLGLTAYFADKMVSAVINAPSQCKGYKKDVIKIGGELDQIQLEKLGLVVPGSTLNIIRDYEVIEKKEIEPPSIVRNLIKCPEPKCITNALPKEPIRKEFVTINKEPVTLRCSFCDRIFEVDLSTLGGSS
jgi:aspartate carbamoyltransferase regulatory subunit